MYEYRAEVIKIVDGDTVDVQIDLGLNVSIVERLRFYGINAPEVRGPSREAGKAATQWLREYLEKINYQIVIRTRKDKKGKYGRYIAVLIDDTDPDNLVNINEEMVKVGHAVEYMKD